MIPLNECSSVLNKSGKLYNYAEVKAIRDFLYKIGELGYNVFKTMSDKTIEIDRWDKLSPNYLKVWEIIKEHKSRGVIMVSKSQPFNLKSAFCRAKLAMYIIDTPEEDEIYLPP